MKSLRRFGLFATVLFTATLLLAGLPGGAGAAGGFSLEQILSSPFPSELTGAAAGGRVAWVFNEQGRRNVWVAEAPAFKARRLTRYDADDGQDITNIVMSRDGGVVIFVRGGATNQAGEVPNPASDADGARQSIWLVRWSEGVPRLVGEGAAPVLSPAGDRVAYVRENQIWLASLVGPPAPKQAFVGRGSNGSPVWAPDGRSLAFVSSRDDHSFIGIYDVAGRSIRWVAPTVDRDGFPRFSPDGKQLAFVRQSGRGGRAAGGANPWAILVAEAATGAAREVWRSTADAAGALPSMAGSHLLLWGADNRLIFTSEQDGWMHLYSMPATGPATGEQPTLLTPGQCEVEQVTLTPDRRSVIYSSNCDDIDRRHLWRVPVGGGPPTQLTSGGGIEWNPVVTGDGDWIAYLGSDARRPAMPHVMSASGAAARPVAAETLPKDFPTAQLVVPQQVIFKAADGWPIHGQLFLPPGGGGRAKLPAVVFMHGGPVRQMLLGWHNRGYYHKAYALNQYLASRGYVVLSVNFRSGVGYGRAFREAPDRGARGASEYQDIVAAGHYLRGRADVDPTRIGLWGGSYGGYLTALGLARNSDLFAAGVDIHGVHDWSVRVAGLPSANPQNAEAAKVARESSPVGSMETWKSPVLLIHGDDDRNVAFSQTVDLVQRLRAAKVPFEQIVFPDDVHDFLLHKNWLTSFTAAADFFDRHLKGAR